MRNKKNLIKKMKEIIPPPQFQIFNEKFKELPYKKTQKKKYIFKKAHLHSKAKIFKIYFY